MYIHILSNKLDTSIVNIKADGSYSINVSTQRGKNILCKICCLNEKQYINPHDQEYFLQIILIIEQENCINVRKLVEDYLKKYPKTNILRNIMLITNTMYINYKDYGIIN